MKISATTWRAEQLEAEEVRREQAVAAHLIMGFARLARGGDAKAFAWMYSERFRDCCRIIGVPPDATRESQLDPDDDPNTPIGNMLRDPQAMRALVAHGMTGRAIARHLEVPEANVRYWLKRHGITRQDPANDPTPTRHEETAREAA